VVGIEIGDIEVSTVRSRGLGPATPIACLYVLLTACSGGLGMHSVATKAADVRESSDTWSLAFSSDGKMLAVSSPNSGEVHLWDWRKGQLIRALQQDDAGGEINGLRFSSDGGFLASAHGATGKNRIVRIWHAATGAVAGDVVEAKSGAFPLFYAALEFTPDASTLIRVQQPRADEDPAKDSFIVYDTKTWERKWAISVNPTQPQLLALSPDGTEVALVGWERVLRPGPANPATPPYVSRSNIVLIDLANQRVRFSSRIMADDCVLEFVAWSSGGQYIAVGGYCFDPRPDPPALEIIDAKSGKAVASATSGSNMIALDYSSDGKYLLVGWAAVGVEIWDSRHAKLLQTISGHPSAARFSPDGRHLGIAEGRGITVWNINQ
jgi:WD40 repeat protein